MTKIAVVETVGQFPPRKIETAPSTMFGALRFGYSEVEPATLTKHSPSTSHCASAAPGSRFQNSQQFQDCQLSHEAHQPQSQQSQQSRLHWEIGKCGAATGALLGAIALQKAVRPNRGCTVGPRFGPVGPHKEIPNEAPRLRGHGHVLVILTGHFHQVIPGGIFGHCVGWPFWSFWRSGCRMRWGE